MCRCQCPARISAPWNMIRSRITFTGSKAGVTASSVLWQMAQSFLGESVGVNDTGDSEKPGPIATLERFMYWLEDKPEWNDGCQRRCSVELHRLSQFTDIRAVWTPDAKVLRNHTCLHSSPNCFHN
ncbi:uncharacterized protein LOC108160614 isoform X1 [Drosophila miranda]|uniref:uncharacterized protein LOC108160614 isoform X1 n=1 Tax=Drosophila miranda TaxID=7229 RepID=UPI0007E75F7F|nr:uncharacterized protein LOC108160614 isoform X1 [Drosophila miranda]